MLSTPASIPAMIDVALASARVPAPFAARAIHTFARTSAGRSHRFRSRTVGAGPAWASRFDSSNAAKTVDTARRERTCLAVA